MALRVVEPVPLRTAGLAALGTGALVAESAAMYRPAAVLGLLLIASGVVLLDAVGDRAIEPRHAGLFALLVGGSLAAWAAVVFVVMGVFSLAPGRHIVLMLSIGAVGTVAGVVLLRWHPRRASTVPDAATARRDPPSSRRLSARPRRTA
jgi:hypothetical protein